MGRYQPKISLESANLPSMKLYHYSKERYPYLASLNIQQGKTSDEDRAYGNGISFLLEPIPLDIGLVLEGKHSFWVPGIELFEYVVDVRDLPEDFTYTITETPEKTKLLYVTQDWSKTRGNPNLIKRYKDQISDMEIAKGYQGNGAEAFVHAAKPLSHDIAGYYKKMLALDQKYPEDKLIQKYAACVPHVIVYLKQKVDIKSVRSIKLKA